MFGYNIIERTAEENSQYIELLETAVDKLEQAISTIKYVPNTGLNAEVMNAIRNAIEIIENVEDVVIYKPVRKEKNR